MRLLVLILNKLDVLDKLLEKLSEQKMGGTILSSTGMAHELASIKEDIPFLISLRQLIDPQRAENKTILIVLKKEKVPKALEIIESVAGSLTNPDTGIVFTVPIDFATGIGYTYHE